MGRIISFAPGAEELFSRDGVGKIHSVFKNTMNVSIRKSIYAIQPCGVWFTPMAIQVDRFLPAQVRVGDPVTFDQWGMKIGNERYDKELAVKRSGRLKNGTLSRKDRCFLLNLIGSQLSRVEEGIAPCVMTTRQEDRVRQEAYEICRRGKELLHDGRLGEAAGNMSSMIGLGPGLTPSGDDFLVGLMSALWVMGEEGFFSLLCRETKRYLKRTNEISAAYLYYACLGEFSEPFHCLFSGSEMEIAVHKAASVGHSSGTDALAGVYFGLEQFG